MGLCGGTGVPPAALRGLGANVAPLPALQRANNAAESWAIPLKDTDDVKTDPFAVASTDKKKRVLKNKLNMLKNMVRPSV